MNLYLMSAAALCGATTFIHCYFGGKAAAVPLLRAKDIPNVPKYTNYYCWHIVSITLAVMTIAFAWAAISPSAVEVAIMAELLAVAFTFWSLGLIVWKEQSFRHLPQWVLFAPISFAGAAGLLV